MDLPSARLQKIGLRSNSRGRWEGIVLLLLVGVLMVVSGDREERLTQTIFGTGLLVIAFVLLTERHVLVIDSQAGFVTRRRGLIHAFPRASFPIADVKHIGLVPHLVKSGRRGRRSVRYRLLVNGQREAVLAEQADLRHARHTGERISAALGIPFDNRIHGVSSRRQADELDLPLAARWIKAGETKDRPSLPAGSRLSVDEMGPYVRIFVPAERHNLKFLALFAMGWAAMAAVFLWLADNPGARLFVYSLFGLGGVLIVCAALAFSGRSKLMFSRGDISFRQGTAPFSRRIELSAIEEMIVAGDGIYLVGDSGELWIDRPQAPADSAFLVDFIAYEIARRSITSTVLQRSAP